MNRAERRRASRSKHKITAFSGHPARLAALRGHAVPKREEGDALDATRPIVQKMIRELREEIQHGHPDDGVITGPLMVASRYVATRMSEQHPDIDQDIFARWLAAQFGDVIREVDIEAFRAWGEGRRERLQEA